MIWVCKLLVPILLLLVVNTDAAEPLIVAHRGLLLHAPENTLANFRACLELRLGFEFDVQRASDGYLGTVDRTTDGTGKVSELTLAEIKRLDPKFAGERVPTVAEVLKLVAAYRRHDVLIAVDLKAVARLAEKHQVLDRLLFIGRAISEPRVRERIKTADAAAVANDPGEFRQALAASNADWVYFRYLPPKEQVEAVHGSGKRAFIAGATVSGNLPENWRQAAEVGIDAVLTDYPLELRSVLRNGRSTSGGREGVR